MGLIRNKVKGRSISEVHIDNPLPHHRYNTISHNNVQELLSTAVLNMTTKFNNKNSLILFFFTVHPSLSLLAEVLLVE